MKVKFIILLGVFTSLRAISGGIAQTEKTKSVSQLLQEVKAYKEFIRTAAIEDLGDKRADANGTNIIFRHRDVSGQYVYMAGESHSVVSGFRFTEPTAAEEKPRPLPISYALHQNYPNPFNPVTTIEYQLAKNGWVSLRVYDTRGQEVASLIDCHQSAGSYQLKFDACHLASGIYFYRLETGSFRQVCKMILIR